MAYNAYYPSPFQNQYYPQSVFPQQQNQQQVQNNNIIWVSGEAGAKSYLVAPNTTVQLWDSEAQVIYLKSADASGMPSMRVIDYTIRDNTPQNVPVASRSDFATKDDIILIQKQIDELKALRAPERKVANESTVQHNAEQ